MGLKSDIAITSKLIIDLLLIFTVARVVGGVFMRFRLPVMLGDLLAGVIFGPVGLGIAKSGIFALVPLLVIVMKVTAFFGLSIVAGQLIIPKILHKIGVITQRNVRLPLLPN